MALNYLTFHTQFHWHWFLVNLIDRYTFYKNVPQRQVTNDYLDKRNNYTGYLYWSKGLFKNMETLSTLTNFIHKSF